jgi:hypothetical protein
MEAVYAGHVNPAGAKFVPWREIRLIGGVRQIPIEVRNGRVTGPCQTRHEHEWHNNCLLTTERVELIEISYIDASAEYVNKRSWHRLCVTQTGKDIWAKILAHRQEHIIRRGPKTCGNI